MASSDDLVELINQRLREYSNEVEEILEDEKKDIGNQAVLKLRKAGNFQDKTGRYRRGWRVKKQGSKYIVYNGTSWRLTHLLENGHALKTGGRTRAFKHIAPVDEWAAQEFENKVKVAIGKG